MQWQIYQACCHVRAMDPTVRICPDCGHLLLRCRGFRECSTLLAPVEHCQVHVAPQLFLRAGEVPKAREGDRLALPLVLRNASTIADLRVDGLYDLRANAQPESLQLHWDRLKAGGERDLVVETPRLEASGSVMTRLLFVLVSTLDGVAERYAFEGSILLHVGRAEQTRVVQNITVQGGTFAAGASAVVQTGPSAHVGSQSWMEGSQAEARLPLPLERAERYEVTHGLRGYPESSLRVPRTVEVMCSGFVNEDAPREQLWRPFLASSVLRCGRNGRHVRSRDAVPNDLCIRAYDASSGALDLARSMRVSASHFAIELKSERLRLRVLGQAPTFLDGQVVGPGEDATVAPKCCIAVLDPGPGGIHLDVSMGATAGLVDRIELRRTDCLGGS